MKMGAQTNEYTGLSDRELISKLGAVSLGLRYELKPLAADVVDVAVDRIYTLAVANARIAELEHELEGGG